MPQQKASSFADDLQQVRQRSFADDLAEVRSTTASNDADMPAGRRLVEIGKGAAKRVGLMPIEIAKLATGLLSLDPRPGVSVPSDAVGRGLDRIAAPLRPANDFQGFGGLVTDVGTIGATPSLGVTAKVARGMARPLMKWGLRPSPAILREFPTVVDDALNEGISLTKKGQQRWSEAMAQSNMDTVRAIGDARKSGASIAADDVIPPSLTDARERVARVAQTGQADRAASMADAVAAREAGMRGVFTDGRMDPIAAHQNKLTHQVDAEQAYRKQLLGQSVNDVDLLMDEGAARAYRQAIEGVAPSVKDSNARTQRLIGVGKAMDTAQAKAGSHILSEYFTVAGALSGNPQLAVPAALLARPAWASRLALAVDKFKNRPDLLGAAIKAIVLEATLADSGASQPVASHPQR